MRRAKNIEQKLKIQTCITVSIGNVYKQEIKVSKGTRNRQYPYSKYFTKKIASSPILEISSPKVRPDHILCCSCGKYEEVMLCLHVHYSNTTLSLTPQVGGLNLLGKYILLPITEFFLQQIYKKQTLHGGQKTREKNFFWQLEYSEVGGWRLYCNLLMTPLINREQRKYFPTVKCLSTTFIRP